MHVCASSVSCSLSLHALSLCISQSCRKLKVEVEFSVIEWYGQRLTYYPRFGGIMWTLLHHNILSQLLKALWGEQVGQAAELSFYFCQLLACQMNFRLQPLLFPWPPPLRSYPPLLTVCDQVSCHLLLQTALQALWATISWKYGGNAGIKGFWGLYQLSVQKQDFFFTIPSTSSGLWPSTWGQGPKGLSLSGSGANLDWMSTLPAETATSQYTSLRSGLSLL